MPTFLVLDKKNWEGKGEWQKDPARGAAKQWQPVASSPMCPVGERVRAVAFGARISCPTHGEWHLAPGGM